jgi:isopentenyldiphosphate isomerase
LNVHTAVIHDKDMVIDVVDDRDHPVGSVRRSTVFSQKANFRTAHVFVFNSSGNLLVQRLAAGRERHPLQWGSSVASYVPSGQSYELAAVDRARAELGIRDLQLSELCRSVMLDEGCRKFIHVFGTSYDGPLQIDTSHIGEARFVSVHQLIGMMARERFTPTFLHIIREIFSNRIG